VNTARSSIAARPPPWGRARNPGSNGSTISHNASGTSRKDNASTTTVHYAAHKIRAIRDMLLACQTSTRLLKSEFRYRRARIRGPKNDPIGTNTRREGAECSPENRS